MAVQCTCIRDQYHYNTATIHNFYVSATPPLIIRQHIFKLSKIVAYKSLMNGTGYTMFRMNLALTGRAAERMRIDGTDVASHNGFAITPEASNMACIVINGFWLHATSRVSNCFKMHLLELLSQNHSFYIRNANAKRTIRNQLGVSTSPITSGHRTRLPVILNPSMCKRQK